MRVLENGDGKTDDGDLGGGSRRAPELVRRRYGAGQGAVDVDPGDRREALESLRTTAREEGQVLLDQLDHRWRHPHCPACLYVLTCTLLAPDRGALVAATGELVQKLPCTKVGQAKRTVAARIDAYKSEPLGGLEIADPA
jgi:hypothetical protein